MEYLPRVLDARVKRLLAGMGAVVLEGPRACGKTSTALQHANSSVRLDIGPQVRALAEHDPLALLGGKPPLLVDEWQLAPDLWNVIRHEIDARQAPGQFILSGSVTPPDDPGRHSGAGRFARVRMRPMALGENGRSSGQVTLKNLGAERGLSGVRSPLGYRDLAAEACRGGWPGLLSTDTDIALEFNRSYLRDITSSEIVSSGGRRHDRVRMERLLGSLARNTATEVTVARLTADVSADGSGISRDTVRNYLDSLATLYVVEEQPAWSVGLRSRTRLRRRAKQHFCDPALACAALGVNPKRLAADPEFFGQIFESMVYRDLSAYADALGGCVFHYRDETGLEVDFVVEFPDGTWAALEAKLGEKAVASAEANLLKLKSIVNTDLAGEPLFLAVVTGAEFGYTRDSGVHVVPLGAMRGA